MKFQIKDVKKAVEFIELIKLIKQLSNHLTFMCSTEQIYIQVMDNSHVCLVDITIPNSWFHLYESKNITFSVSTNIMSKICSMYTLDSILEIIVDEENPDIMNIHLLHNLQNKLFSIPLMNIDKDTLTPSEIDTKLDFQMNTKTLEKYVNELAQFGEDIIIECRDDKIYLCAEGIEGKLNVEIDNDKLDEFNVVEGYNFKGSYSIKYLQYVTKLFISYPNINLFLDENNPLMITFTCTDIKIKFFIAPKCSDSDE
jgi:proliferating cell nuclear antigen PCNA